MIMMTNCKFLSVTVWKDKKGCFETPAVPRQLVMSEQIQKTQHFVITIADRPPTGTIIFRLFKGNNAYQPIFNNGIEYCNIFIVINTKLLCYEIIFYNYYCQTMPFETKIVGKRTCLNVLCYNKFPNSKYFFNKITFRSYN